MLVVRWVATALFIVAVPTFLLLSNVRIAAMESRVYEYSFDRYNAVERTGIDRAQLNRAAREIVEYFGNDESLLASRVTIDGRDEALFSPREVLHMRDVKDLFRRVFQLHEIAFVYVIAYVAAVFLWGRERSMAHLARQCITTGVVTAGLVGAVAVGAVVGFDDLFRRFHLLSFSNNFWLLDPRTDALVQMFPQGFWFDVTLGVGAVTVAEGALLALAGYGYASWLSRRERRAAATRALAAEESI